MKVKRLALFAERTVCDEVSQLSSDQHQLVEIAFGGRVSNVQGSLELNGPISLSQCHNLLARGRTASQNCEMDEEVLRPGIERIDCGKADPSGVLRQAVIRRFADRDRRPVSQRLGSDMALILAPLRFGASLVEPAAKVLEPRQEPTTLVLDVQL